MDNLSSQDLVYNHLLTLISNNAQITFLVFLFTIIPTFIYFLYFYKQDKIPLATALKVFFGGMLTIVVVLFIQYFGKNNPEWDIYGQAKNSMR